MLTMHSLRAAVLFGASVALAACSDAPRSSTDVTGAIAEVTARDNQFTNYPMARTTYLSFNHAHGYQVNFIGPNGRSWLWYPGNRQVVPEQWKRDTVRGIKAICFGHPANSYNPVTKRRGGGYSCQEMTLSQKSIVASLKGDPFNLASGAVPYRLDRCQAPEAFVFDRKGFGCR